jgi:hypothetical protein
MFVFFILLFMVTKYIQLYTAAEMSRGLIDYSYNIMLHTYNLGL